MKVSETDSFIRYLAYFKTQTYINMVDLLDIKIKIKEVMLV